MNALHGTPAPRRPDAPADRTRRRIAAVALVALAPFAAVACGGDDSSTTADRTDPSGPTSTAPRVETSTTMAGVDITDKVWPLAGSTTTFTTAREAALDFAVKYLGMAEAAATATTEPDAEEADGTATVSIRPAPDSGPTTLVSVLDANADGWIVVAAASDQVQLAAPRAGAPSSSPLAVLGTSTSFEANIQLELRSRDSVAPIASTFTEGGSNGEFAPFQASLTPPPGTTGPLVLVVYVPDASGRSQMLAATVVPLNPAQ